MKSPREHDLPLELLAGYVDGELDSDLRKRVEEWLDRHPEAWSELASQREWSGLENPGLGCDPPMPTKAAWGRALHCISEGVKKQRAKPRRWGPIVGTLSAAAALLLAVLAFDRSWTGFGEATSAGTSSSVSADDDGDFQFATAEDVELIQLPEAAAPLLVIGTHPMQDQPFVLARADDLEFFNIGPDDQGAMPSVDLTVGPEVPMLVVRPRR